MKLRMRGLLLMFTAVAALAQPVEVAKGVFLLRGTYEPGAQPDGNSVIFETSDGLVVVDTGRHEAHTRALLDLEALRAVNGGRGKVLDRDAGSGGRLWSAVAQPLLSITSPSELT